MGITSKIFNGIAETVKSFFDVRAPVFFIKVIFPFLETGGICQVFAGGRKRKGAAFIQAGKAGHKFPFEFIPQDFNRDKELSTGEVYLIVFGEPAAGNNTVHMYMIIKFLVPRMEDLYDPGHCPEILLISR